MTLLQLPLDAITVGERHRVDMGDLHALAASIERVGLLHPIVVTADYRLIAGERRIEAFRLLGRDAIPATVAHDLTEVIAQQQAELDENTCRKDFTPSEAVAKGSEYEPFERAAAEMRQRATQFGGDGAEKFSTPSNGRALDRVAAAVGMSRPTYQKATELVEAAEGDPETFAPLVAEMDRTGNVTRAHRKLKQLRDEQKVEQGEFETPDGAAHTIVVDPPWEYDVNLLGRSRPEYAVMGIDRLEDLGLGKWAADDFCHLYLWTTNAMIPKAVQLVEAWGFEYVTMLTWVKPHIGTGSYFRNSTEHVLFAKRGDKNTRSAAKSMPTHFEAPRGEHSEKPASFYEMVELASYPPYLDVFARRGRDGWQVWGNVDGR